MTFEKIEDAVKFWIRGFNCIPTEAIKYYVDLQDITPVTLGENVFFDSESDINICGEVIDIDYQKKTYTILVEDNLSYEDNDDEDDDEIIGALDVDLLKKDDNYVCEVYEIPFDEVFLEDEEQRAFTDIPEWGTMWTFNDEEDLLWIEQKESQIKMAECGFRLFWNDEFGYLFGIDFSGIDFFQEYWLPLYEIRGLDWKILQQVDKKKDKEKENATS